LIVFFKEGRAVEVLIGEFIIIFLFEDHAGLLAVGFRAGIRRRYELCSRRFDSSFELALRFKRSL
jgi:hypothetical protein